MNPIKRAPFIRSIAAAAGKTSPDIEYDEIEEAAINTAAPPSIEEAEAAGQLILLAEDNVTNQKVILRQLNSLGFAALIADDGEQALEAMEKNDFAVLLTDCHMPNLDGFGLTRSVREKGHNAPGRRLPIVAITASALTEEVAQCYEAGMDDFLSKPVEIAKLHGALKKWMPSTPKPSVATAPPPTVAADSPIDLSFLKEIFGDEEETIVEILKEFVDPSEECREEVQAAVKTNTLEEVALGSHKLKSAAKSIGAYTLAEICEEMELASKKGDWAPVKELAPKLNTEMSEVVEYINTL
ncbi:MAG: hypothetical protein CMM59_20160 [Rhodospirillaceae bacterium]|nr:hypothetical protein [Rhodospirillaceae bacterium]